MRNSVVTISLDLSTKSTGYCVWRDQNLVLFGTLIPGNLVIGKRMSYIKACVSALVKAHEPDFVVFEDYLLSLQSKNINHVRALTQVAELGGMVKDTINNDSIAVIITYSIPDIKRHVTGKGNASKITMQNALPDGYAYKKEFSNGVVFNTDDEVDAFWAGRIFFGSVRYRTFYSEKQKVGA